MNKIFYFFLVSLFLCSFGWAKTADNEIISQPINIVYATDSNYVTYMRTSIRSVIANKKPDTQIKIYVIGYELSDENIKLIKETAVKNVQIEFVPVTRDLFLSHYLDKRSEKTPNVTLVDNSKFFLTSLLKDVDKVIYLDGDTIVLKDLSDLYAVDLKNFYVAVVDDWQTGWFKNPKRRYFNNGVMLMNLKKMRQDGIEDKLIRYKKHERKARFVTQDAFNFVMYKKALFLPMTYDTFSPEYDDEKNLLSRIKEVLKEKYNPDLYPYETAQEYRKDVVIIHFCGYKNEKPWQTLDFYRPSNQIWYKYAPPEFWVNVFNAVQDDKEDKQDVK